MRTLARRVCRRGGRRSRPEELGDHERSPARGEWLGSTPAETGDEARGDVSPRGEGQRDGERGSAGSGQAVRTRGIGLGGGNPYGGVDGHGGARAPRGRARR